MEDKFFSISEVAKYLNIPKSTLYKLSQKSQIPSVKIGKQLRFRKSSLDKWLTEKEQGVLPCADAAIKPRQILLVDDDALVLKTLSRFLESRNFRVEAVQSGEEALEKAGKLNFDLLITDIKMPGIDGIGTIREIRQIRSKSNKPPIPEIIITGYIDTQAQTEAEKLGITDYIYKPFIISDFIKTVKEKLELSADLN